MKQINLHAINYKEAFQWFGWLVAIVLLLFMFKCNPEPSFAKVEIPEKKGSFEGKKPKHVEITPKIIHTKEKVYIKGEKVYINNPLNEKLLQENEQLKIDFEKANDSIKSLLFKEAIAINSFSTKFEDDNLELNIAGIVRGEVQEITPSYIIKKQSIQVPNKQTVFRLLAGAEIGNTIDFNQFIIKGNIGFQNKSGDYLNASYDTEKRVWIGFNKSIFNIKK